MIKVRVAEKEKDGAGVGVGIARRFATVIAYGGGGVGILGGILAVEGLWARRTVGPPMSDPPEAAGRYIAPEADAVAAPLSLALLGDSSAAGLGVTSAVETPGAQLALGLSTVSRRPVRLHSVAAIGARSSHVGEQVTATLRANPRPDVAVVIIGANDVTHLCSITSSAGQLTAAIRRLRRAGARVVVATCPDLGTIEPIPQPLRALARSYGRRLAAAQTVASVEAGARAVSLGDLLGPQFLERPREMFSPDRFHPSAAGYAAAAGALLPSVVASLGLTTPGGVGEAPVADVLPVREAAAEAARDPGLEVMRGTVAGRERGPKGRFAALRHRPARRTAS